MSYRPNSVYQQSMYQQSTQSSGTFQSHQPSDSSSHAVVQGQDVVSGDQYRYALQNFRIAHEKVEQQRLQLEEQERQVAQLRARIALLEGGSGLQIQGPGGNTIDDFSIKNAASQLDKLINRWAADIIRTPPAPLRDICAGILADVASSAGLEIDDVEGTPMQIQAYLRHAMAETISEGFINCLIATNSSEANVQLTRIHEHIFAQLMHVLNGTHPISGGISILDSAYAFSRMLHGAGTSSGDAFYRAFVPELGSTLYPRQIELVKRCLKSERGQLDRVGATIFPGLVKVTQGIQQPNGQIGDNIQTVVRRAQVICECALGGAVSLPPPDAFAGDGPMSMAFGSVPMAPM